MPYRDGTGPMGDGRPGRGMGPCNTKPNQFGFGRRNGRGNRNRWCLRNIFKPAQSDPAFYPYTREDLLSQKESMESQLKWLNEQLDKE